MPKLWPLPGSLTERKVNELIDAAVVAALNKDREKAREFIAEAADHATQEQRIILASAIITARTSMQERCARIADEHWFVLGRTVADEIRNMPLEGDSHASALPASPTV